MDNVTPRAQKLLVLARKQADRLHHGYVGTEHLLLGLLELNEGVGFTALQNMNADIAELRRELDNRVNPGSETTIAMAMPCTPRFHKTMRLGAQEARGLGHNYLGTEHILLGLLHSGSGLAGEVLRAQRVELKKTRAVIQATLKTSQSKAQPGRKWS